MSLGYDKNAYLEIYKILKLQIEKVWDTCQYEKLSKN